MMRYLEIEGSDVSYSNSARRADESSENERTGELEENGTYVPRHIAPSR